MSQVNSITIGPLNQSQRAAWNSISGAHNHGRQVTIGGTYQVINIHGTLYARNYNNLSAEERVNGTGYTQISYNPTTGTVTNVGLPGSWRSVPQISTTYSNMLPYVHQGYTSTERAPSTRSLTIPAGTTHIYLSYQGNTQLTNGSNFRGGVPIIIPIEQIYQSPTEGLNLFYTPWQCGFRHIQGSNGRRHSTEFYTYLPTNNRQSFTIQFRNGTNIISTQTLPPAI